MPSSLRDVAEVAGVAQSTVSRALRNSPKVKPETRERIQRIAKEVGYVPSAIARGLATRRTSTLGVVVFDITDPFIADLVSAIDREARSQGYSVILSTCGADPQQEMAAIKLLLQQRVDAVIVPDPLVADSSLPQLEQLGIPIVLMGRTSYAYSVGTDNRDGTYQATKYLIGLGHQRIAYIGGRRSPEESAERRAGYEMALREAGLAVVPEWVLEGDGWASGGRTCTGSLLSLPNPPTALVCFNDLTASGALLTLYDAGLEVPGDVSVVGFDDSSLASLLTPPLTTVMQHKDDLSRYAIDVALARVKGDRPPVRVVVASTLVVRRSTGPVATGPQQDIKISVGRIRHSTDPQRKGEEDADRMEW